MKDVTPIEVLIDYLTYDEPDILKSYDERNISCALPIEETGMIGDGRSIPAGKGLSSNKYESLPAVKCR